MGNSVAAAAAHTRRYPPEHGISIYARSGARKYINASERASVIAAAARLEVERALFVATLVWTGARVSEVLALRPRAFQVTSGVVAIKTLKRRRPVMREVPIPPALMQALDEHFHLAVAQQEDDAGDAPLWRFCRETAWRIVKGVMERAGVQGRAACPRGLRHGFGIGTLQAGVPITLVQRWMGHAHLSTTAIYADVSGPEEYALAERYWRWGERAVRTH